MYEMHSSIWVDSDHHHLLQAGDQIHLQQHLRQEGVDPLASALLRCEGRLILKDFSELSQDCLGPHNLRH